MHRGVESGTLPFQFPRFVNDIHLNIVFEVKNLLKRIVPAYHQVVTWKRCKKVTDFYRLEIEAQLARKDGHTEIFVVQTAYWLNNHINLRRSECLSNKS
jgi:hypothetical protein